jgi:hypothetical protein
MNWFLIFQVLATWPQSPPQVQFLGPMPDEGICIAAQAKVEKAMSNLRSTCIGLPNGQAPVQPAAPK